MRLSARDQQAIRAIVEQEFGAKATVRLFATALTEDIAAALDENPLLAERVEARGWL